MSVDSKSLLPAKSKAAIAKRETVTTERKIIT
jgi:hypothetical protein